MSLCRARMEKTRKYKEKEKMKLEKRSEKKT
jgi:hypothetical protein